MKKKTTLIVLFLSLAFISEFRAQAGIDTITKTFFQTFETDPIKAIDDAFLTNTWMEQNVEGVESVKNKFKDILPLIGEYRGFELINEKSIGECLKLKSFMVRYDRQPVRFTFVFYKPGKSWKVQNLKWDVSLDDEIEASASMEKN